MADGPYELTGEIEELLTPLARDLVANRRGSTVWKVTGAGGLHAVKLGYPSATHAHTALTPAREAFILRGLGRDGISWGEWSRGTWSVQPWHRGPDLWHLWEPYRTAPTAELNGDAALCTAHHCAEELAALHQAGWVHGDVQPAHFIVGSGATRLIDLGLARGGEIPAAYDFPYRGCLVHYESPEISRSVLETGQAVPTREADVFALGASLFISVTGLRAIDFPPDAERAEQRRVIARGRHRPVRIPGVLGEIVAATLRPEPADRPTMAEVCAALRAH
ncbi:protein kinase domain-containing protein [Streptomyces litchfieldiae]|uniref:non-specific serine/threonine protein kinase n=1 Tax=Streptomyces litchfieldiae TaxID=3075543 RepID=A0ABU2MMH5_9ACTN|nr:protein kinase [Streptomyces sp. DSM 44938]MDT0342676.1 protein kinase [Streptomyces sp. DSM 44938]